MELAALGPISVNVAVVVSVALAVRLGARGAGITAGRSALLLIALAVVALVGGRLHYILNHPTAYAGRWHEAAMLWKGGFHLPGGIVGLLIGAPLVSRVFGVSASRFGDAIVPAVAVGVALTRLGCLFAGCCAGEPCSHAWCIAYPPTSVTYIIQRHLGVIAPDAVRSQPVLPLQAGFVASALAIALLAVWMRTRKRYDGQIALVSAFLFALSTAALEPWRGFVPAPQYWGSLPRLAWEAIGLAATLGVMLAWTEIAQRRTARDAERAVLA
jgi:phosphatidylglycerol:prolipoprotein diacylglycerol transferase